jgi:hypothetical protein
MQEPSLPLHLQSVWNFNLDRVGLAYLATVLPALICKSHSLTVHNLVLTTVAASPLAGYYVDQVGSDDITCISLVIECKFHCNIIGAGGQGLKDLINRCGSPSDTKLQAGLVRLYGLHTFFVLFCQPPGQRSLSWEGFLV